MAFIVDVVVVSSESEAWTSAVVDSLTNLPASGKMEESTQLPSPLTLSVSNGNSSEKRYVVLCNPKMFKSKELIPAQHDSEAML